MLTPEEYQALLKFIMSRPLDGTNLVYAKFILGILEKLNPSKKEK